MDRKLEILLGSQRNVESVNTEEFTKAELTRKTSEITEFTVNDVVDSTQVFDDERAANPVYRIYGRIEYMSLLNGLKDNYAVLADFFTPDFDVDCKTLKNSFDFYLVKPASSGYVNITGTDKYIRYFEVIATPDDFELFPAGFTTNVYDEQTYAFSFNTDFDVSAYFDNFGFPVTELFLYPQYKLKKNGTNVWETMKYTKYTASGADDKDVYPTTGFQIGEFVRTTTGAKIGDVVNYNKSTYTQTLVNEQIVYIKTEYKTTGAQTRYLIWKYNPFIPLRLRYLSDDLSTAEMSRITENSTSIEVFLVSSPSSQNRTVVKSDYQVITTTGAGIKNWTSQTGSGTQIQGSLSNGELIIFGFGDFSFTYTTKIRFTEGSYKYFGRTVLQKNLGGGWTDVPDSEIIFRDTNTERTITVVDTVTYGTEYRIFMQLIPNPAEIVPEDTDVPYYATQLDNGQYVWRDIVPQGFTEPLSGNGVDYPFMNGRRYLFAPLILSVSPDLDDDDNSYNTRNRFAEISMENNFTTLNFEPESENNLDDIGKPCQ